MKHHVKRFLRLYVGIGLLCSFLLGMLSACQAPTDEKGTTVETQGTEAPEDASCPFPKIASLRASFFQDLNYDRSKGPNLSVDIVPPGSLPDPATVPDTDRTTLYGKQYQIRLAADEASDTFYFRYEQKNGEARLYVFLTAKVSPSGGKSGYPLLLVFRLDQEKIKGWEDVCRWAESGAYLPVTLLYARNVALDDQMYLANTYWADTRNQTPLRASDAAKETKPGSLIGCVDEKEAKVFGVYLLPSNSFYDRFRSVITRYVADALE